MVEKKLLFQIQRVKIVYPNKENMIVMPIMKRMEIIMNIQDYLISKMNINYKGNGGKKAFAAIAKL